MADKDNRQARQARLREEPRTPSGKKARLDGSSSGSSTPSSAASSSSKSDEVAGDGGGARGLRQIRDEEEGAGELQKTGAGGRLLPRALHTREPVYDDSSLAGSMNMMGLKENETRITPNYYSISALNGTRFSSNIQFHRYDVRFNPNVPRMFRSACMNLFNQQHFNEVPIGFDGNAMAFAVAAKVANTALMQPTTTRTVRKPSGEEVEVTLSKTTDKPLVADQGAEFLQALNTCLRRFLMREHKLKPFFEGSGGALWDTKHPTIIKFSDRGGNKPVEYHVIRGYDITIKALQSGFHINVDDRTRIVKDKTVFEWMQDIRRTDSKDYKRIIQDNLLNRILLNIVSGDLIRVSAVHFDEHMHPGTYKFMWRRPIADQAGQYEERETTIKDYFKIRYNKDIMSKQPLIETMPSRKLRPNASAEERENYEKQKNLIPAELLYFTGLDQSEKSNFFLMKKINEVTKPSALQKKADLDDIVRKYLLNTNVQNNMQRLQMKLSVADDVDNNRVPAHGLSISLVARVIKPPEIDMGPNVRGGAQPPTLAVVTQGQNGPMINFETETRARGPISKHSENYKIAFVFTRRDEVAFRTFYTDCVIKAAGGMGLGDVFSGQQGTFYAEGQRTSDFSVAIETCCQAAKARNFTPFIFICVPDELKERYDQIKQVSLSNYGYLSQVMRARTIFKPMLSVGTKVVMQVLAKMDVHHDGERRGSVQACVGTLDTRASVFYQRSRLVAPGEEISVQSAAYSIYIKDMIRERQRKDIKTETIIVYRDGVSEGQIELALETEYGTLQQMLNEWPNTRGGGGDDGSGACPYDISKVPKIVFIFVMKRHSTRFFQFYQDGSTVDDAPGGGRGGFDRGGGGRGGGGPGSHKRFENPKPGTVVSNGIVRSDRAEFYLATHDTKEGSLVPMRYEILRNETQPPPGMSKTEAEARGYRPLSQEDIEMLTFYLTALYPNQCATIRVPVVCQLAQKFALLSGQHLHLDVVDMQTNLRKKMFYL